VGTPKRADHYAGVGRFRCAADAIEEVLLRGSLVSVPKKTLSKLRLAASLNRLRPGLYFLAEIPTFWDETRVQSGAVGRFITVAWRRGTRS